MWSRVRISAGSLFSKNSAEYKGISDSKPNSASFDIYENIHFDRTTEFFEYLDTKGYGEGHLKHLQIYFKKHLAGKEFKNPLNLMSYITKQKNTVNIVKTGIIKNTNNKQRRP